ncbi:MAG: alpha/beta hydrolase [Pseudomonadota bacterium]
MRLEHPEWRSHALWPVLLGCLFLAAPSFAEPIEIPFLSARDLGTTEGPSVFFGDQRSSLRAGRCVVEAIELGGYLPALDAVPALMREPLLSINSVSLLPGDDPLDILDDPALAAPPVLYVHGYNIDFEKGCRRAALLKANAHLEGRLLWFTWPSDGDVANYSRDEADLYWSVPDLADLMIEMSERLGPDTPLDIIGHSLGARGVALAAQQVAFRRPDISLGHVVLVAPDMDFDIFERALPQIHQVSQGITVYVSALDRPLNLSRQVHGYPRLGQADNPFWRLWGVSVVDVSDLEPPTPTGHLYHIHTKAVGDDMDLLLRQNLRPSDRATLTQDTRNVWRLLP